MINEKGSPGRETWYRLRAWSVHFYTSLGLILSLLAIVAIAWGDAWSTVVYMAVAMLIDGTDGMLARRWDVKRWTPNFDGRKLDDIIDFLTYTFIPVFFLLQFEVLSWPWTLALALVLLASAYGFCSASAKTDDGFFTGFPSYWNVVALYLYWLRWPVWLSGLAIVLFALLTFVPGKYISLNQTIPWRRTSRGLLVLWAALLIMLWLNFEQPDRLLVYLSLFYPVYYFGASWWLQRQPSS